MLKAVHFVSYRIKVLLLVFQQTWKHLSSKVCEILEELRAVQVCLRAPLCVCSGIFEQANVCCLRLNMNPGAYSETGLQGKQINRKTAPSEEPVC